ncbi:unnamed protein product, partial [Symbiodinium sp. CCMP2592]
PLPPGPSLEDREKLTFDVRMAAWKAGFKYGRAIQQKHLDEAQASTCRSTPYDSDSDAPLLKMTAGEWNCLAVVLDQTFELGLGKDEAVRRFGVGQAVRVFGPRAILPDYPSRSRLAIEARGRVPERKHNPVPKAKQKPEVVRAAGSEVSGDRGTSRPESKAPKAPRLPGLEL